MATYSTPRAWDGTETGNVSSYLSVMRTNNVALYDRLPKVNIGFYGAELSSSGVGGQIIWYMQHRLSYLHYHFECTQSTIDDVKLFVTTNISSPGTAYINHGGTYSDGDIMTSAGSDSGSAADVSGLTVGSFYFVIVRIELSGSGRLFVRNLYESSES